MSLRDRFTTGNHPEQCGRPHRSLPCWPPPPRSFGQYLNVINEAPCLKDLLRGVTLGSKQRPRGRGCDAAEPGHVWVAGVQLAGCPGHRGDAARRAQDLFPGRCLQVRQRAWAGVGRTGGHGRLRVAEKAPVTPTAGTRSWTNTGRWPPSHPEAAGRGPRQGAGPGTVGSARGRGGHGWYFFSLNQGKAIRNCRRKPKYGLIRNKRWF